MTSSGSPAATTTVAAFALTGRGSYYGQWLSDIVEFSGTSSQAAIFTLDTETNNLTALNGSYAGANAIEYIASGVGDFLRWGTELASQSLPVQCGFIGSGDSCALSCGVNGWATNCFYPPGGGDVRQYAWYITPSGYCSDEYMLGAPNVVPVPPGVSEGSY